VRLALDDDLPPLRADPTQLERAFANLLENAVVHGEEQPVLVRSRLVGPRLVVRVVDRGPGVPENLRERIFEPFYRAPGAASGAGSGLGLAIARGFIEANGGEVEVESLPGQGSSFVVTFAVPDTDPPSAVPYADIPVIRNSGKGATS
jgi:two-component system sensor histidine kinase KdpD